MFSLSSLLGLARWQKRLISAFVDIIGLVIIASLAISLRLGEFWYPLNSYWMSILLLPILAIPVFIRQGLYRAVVRYIGHHFAVTVFLSVSLTTLLWMAGIYMLDLAYPRTAIVITWLLGLLYISGTRIIVRWFLSDYAIQKGISPKQVVIFGAGSSGQQLLSAISKIPTTKVVAFIDDDTGLKRSEISSVRIYPRSALNDLIDNDSVSELLIAIPSLSGRQRKNIINWAEKFSIKVSTLPAIDEIIGGKVSFSDIRALDIEDLLGRDSVPPKAELLEACISNKVVMVTGAGGSIGSELCRQIIKLKPSKLILFELSEFSVYSIEHELTKQVRTLGLDIEILAVLGSIRDEKKLQRLISNFQVETIYHAAAYKHVPMVEHNIQEGILNNSFGTHTLAKVAAENRVKNFVLISTDKAVRPTNMMGASKRLAEMALQALQVEYPDTCFAMVRFGNVLGSSGSVIPLFKKQIEQGGPVTVTHKEITRYFMTIPEAASLVIQAGSMGIGGDVFVLDMGEPVKIADLALKVIHLSGLEEVDAEGHGDIEIQYTGLRPGEKLYEELLIGENVDGTDHPRIMKAHETFISYEELLQEFASLEEYLSNYDYLAVNNQLTKIVSGFNHTSGIVDYLDSK
ncbi:MAG: UDP-N-acetylglucosamine 4,6-dehydratase [Thiomicrorhabdus sp.]|nr:MAG: UDP-N-acetylglucosamine 4,6-dehydratase [Thiomicrorhabdus sp.]